MVEQKRIVSRPDKDDLRRSFRYALRGFRYALQAERNVRIHSCAAMLVLLLSAWLRLTDIEWLLIIMAIALVFIAEMFNTVVELMIDLITTEQSPLARRAKDIAAGAVLVAALTAAAIGCAVFGPRLWLIIDQLLH